MKIRIDLVPVVDDTGSIVLYDIFIDGVWHGSRRTIRYCNEYTRQLEH